MAEFFVKNSGELKTKSLKKSFTYHWDLTIELKDSRQIGRSP
ncbi:hypothetical protein CKA32_006390 [Geitlerinema sp. FC II]|nr:hypothetical protein CKA32_000726 [Geitlerinema sp. FC II]PPT06647.1 hypothetical protein CKA32_005252 [Geitlerinema sp. FC II]PPT08614.1 hypothetical protein CKA32_006390 [Geitlerinema sp. FC II]